jgi:hypothetical protein
MYVGIYTRRHSWEDISADLNKSAEKQGFQFTDRKTANSAQATVWTISCTRNRMFEDKDCQPEYENGDAQFAAGMKVVTVKENHWVEQRGPTGIKQPRKMEISRPTQKEDTCPLKVSICLNLKDDVFYLSKKGSVGTHCGHVRCGVIFDRPDQIDKMWRRCSRILRSLMLNHPQIFVYCTKWKIAFMILRSYPILSPKHRRPGFQTGA